MITFVSFHVAVVLVLVLVRCVTSRGSGVCCCVVKKKIKKHLQGNNIEIKYEY